MSLSSVREELVLIQYGSNISSVHTELRLFG